MDVVRDAAGSADAPEDAPNVGAGHMEPGRRRPSAQQPFSGRHGVVSRHAVHRIERSSDATAGLGRRHVPDNRSCAATGRIQHAIGSEGFFDYPAAESLGSAGVKYLLVSVQSRSGGSHRSARCASFTMPAAL